MSAPQQFKHDRISVIKAQLAILRSINQYKVATVPEVSSLVPVTQIAPSVCSTPCYDRVSLGHPYGSQRPSVIPFVPASTRTVRNPSTTSYQSPTISKIYESELDTPITITQKQLMTFSQEDRTKIQNFAAARRTCAPSTPLIIPVTSASEQFRRERIATIKSELAVLRLDRITAIESELAMLRSKRQKLAPVVRTSFQQVRDNYANISDKNAAVKAPAIRTSPATVNFSPMPTYEALPVPTTYPESTIVRTHPIECYITPHLPASALQSQNDECAAKRLMQTYLHAELSAPVAPSLSTSPDFVACETEFVFDPGASALSAPVAPSLSTSPGFVACETEFVFDPGTSALSTTTRTVTHDPPLTYAVKSIPQLTISSKSLAFLPSHPLQLAYIKHITTFALIAYLLSLNPYTVSHNQPLPLTHEISPLRTTTVYDITYLPYRSLQLAHLNFLVQFITALAITMVRNSISAVWSIAMALTTLYAVPARISRQFYAKPSAQIIICPALRTQGISIYCALGYALKRILDVAGTVTTSMRTTIHRFHDNIVLLWPASRIFALGCIFISRALLCPRKPDKTLSNSSRPFSCLKRHISSFRIAFLCSLFMTEDSQY